MQFGESACPNYVWSTKCRYPLQYYIATQILQTLRSNVQARAGDSEGTVAVYLVNAREYVEVDERRLKDTIRDVGGKWNHSCLLFLPH